MLVSRYSGLLWSREAAVYSNSTSSNARVVFFLTFRGLKDYERHPSLEEGSRGVDPSLDNAGTISGYISSSGCFYSGGWRHIFSSDNLEGA